MEKIIGDWSTEVLMTTEEAERIRMLGKGSECCTFLVFGAQFECIRMSYPTNGAIFTRLEEGAMNAKGEGRRTGCAWENELKTEGNE